MADSIQQSRAEVQRAFDDLLRWAESTTKRSFWEFERGAWKRLMTLGCGFATLFLARTVARPRAIEYRHEGQRYVVRGRRTTSLGTRFGKVSFSRPIGRRVDQPLAACDRPVDRELGLCAGFSLGVVAPLVRLCTLLAFATARGTFAEFHGWAPSSRATLRMVDALGKEARPFLEQVGAPEDDGEIIVIQVDGRGAPHDLGARVGATAATAPRAHGHATCWATPATQIADTEATNQGQEVQERQGRVRGRDLHAREDRRWDRGSHPQASVRDVREPRRAVRLAAPRG